MPKVGKINVTYNSEDKPEVFDIYYNAKERFHVKGLSHDFLKLIEFRDFGYDKEQDLRDTMFWACKKYRELKTAQRKVIIFWLAAGSIFTMNHLGDEHYSGKKKGISEKIGSLGHGIPQASVGIEYWICTETTEGADKKYHRLKDDGSIRYAIDEGKLRSATIMEWSAEREAFFLGMYNRMQDMVYSLSKFISLDEPDMLSMVDKQGALALTGNINSGIVPALLTGSEKEG